MKPEDGVGEWGQRLPRTSRTPRTDRRDEFGANSARFPLSNLGLEESRLTPSIHGLMNRTSTGASTPSPRAHSSRTPLTSDASVPAIPGVQGGLGYLIRGYYTARSVRFSG